MAAQDARLLGQLLVEVLPVAHVLTAEASVPYLLAAPTLLTPALLDAPSPSSSTALPQPLLRGAPAGAAAPRMHVRRRVSLERPGACSRGVSAQLPFVFLTLPLIRFYWRSSVRY